MTTLEEKVDDIGKIVSKMEGAQSEYLPGIKKMLDDHETRIRVQEKISENGAGRSAIIGSIAGGGMGVFIAWIFSKLRL